MKTITLSLARPGIRYIKNGEKITILLSEIEAIAECKVRYGKWRLTCNEWDGTEIYMKSGRVLTVTEAHYLIWNTLLGRLGWNE